MRNLLHGLLSFLFLLIAGCQVRPVPDPVPVDVPANWDQEPVDIISWPKPGWWMGFGSAELDQLMIDALDNNLDLAVAAARVQQAEARAMLAGVALLPSLDFGTGAARQGSIGGDGKTGTSNHFDVNLGASYEIDFWGRNRARQNAAQESLYASRFDRETVVLTMTSSVVTTYLQVLSLRERIAIARLNLENAENVLKLVESRVKYGAASPLDMAQQKSEVARQRAAIPPLQQQERDARSALALLLGKPPQGFDVVANSLEKITLPRVMPGMPSELLTRRPDIQSSEAQLRAANADIAAARAAYFPSINLTGSAGLGSTVLSSLLDGGILYNLAVSLAQPVFDAGRREAEEELAISSREELVRSYRISIINAFADVEIALGAIQSSANQQEHQMEQLRQAEIAFQLAQRRYKEGAVDLLTVLDVQRTLYGAQDQHLQIKFSHLRAMVSLYRALGGGWEIGSRSPNP